VAVVVALVVFAKAPHRHACFPSSLPPFPLFAVVVARVNFEEEEEEEASDDDLIGTLDPVSKSAIILFSPFDDFSFPPFTLLLSLFESAASLEKRTVLLVVVTLPLVEGVLLLLLLLLKEEEEEEEREERRERVEM
jgi:hypothetical protein